MKLIVDHVSVICFPACSYVFFSRRKNVIPDIKNNVKNNTKKINVDIFNVKNNTKKIIKIIKIIINIF